MFLKSTTFFALFSPQRKKAEQINYADEDGMRAMLFNVSYNILFSRDLVTQ